MDEDTDVGECNQGEAGCGEHHDRSGTDAQSCFLSSSETFA